MVLEMNKLNSKDSLGDTRMKRVLLRLLNDRGLNMTGMLNHTSGHAGNPGLRLNSDIRLSTLIAYANYIGVTLPELMLEFNNEA